MRSHSSGLYFVALLSRVGSLRCERTAQGSDFSCQHCMIWLQLPMKATKACFVTRPGAAHSSLFFHCFLTVFFRFVSVPSRAHHCPFHCVVVEQETVSADHIAGNADIPEGTLDAIVQVAVCKVFICVGGCACMRVLVRVCICV